MLLPTTSVPALGLLVARDGGLWTIYDDESKSLVNATAPEAASIQRRCGGNNIHCDYVGFRARADLCGHLMDILGAPENRDLSMTPCCISWSARVTGLKVNMLFGAAGPMLGQCARDNLVSARATDVDLNGSCVAQCMSNRPEGCAL
ncbi:hypothetical protein C8A01DRAFT_42029 [Parachaetomium inaequale]|uniref:WD-like domain-containing protein n=1 Tax=Parachaetomium inaequale TaxID=2588326 RepID=A0AAN6SL04_9PEZI|nr:hypothetical protein C8A01DRAFT_42029 [Parachaetomium inaequale]